MKQFFGRIPFPAKLILIVSIPLVFVIYLFLELYREKSDKLDLLNSFIERIQESVDITNLIDNLQTERNLSYEFALTGEKKEQLNAQRLRSDSLINRIGKTPYLAGFRGYTFLEDLDSNRSRIDRKAINANPAAHYYTTVIFRLNTLNPVPPGVMIYLPEIYSDVVSQKLLSEMITYLSIASTNVYTALYTKAYMVETLMGTQGTYDVLKSYEREFLAKASLQSLKQYKELRSTHPLGPTMDYLDSLFNSFSFGNRYDDTGWKAIYIPALDRLRMIQQGLLKNVKAGMDEHYQEEIKAKNSTLIILILSFVLATILVGYAIYSISKVLTALRTDAERIARGAAATRKAPVTRDVIGQLADSINKIDETNKSMAKTAEAIGKGEFDVPVYVRGREDILGNALVEMKKGLQQLTKAEKDIANLAAIVQSSQDAIISKTLDGIITSWNPGAERLFGYTAEEMIGQPITKLIPAADLDQEKMIIEKIKKGERIEHMNVIRLHKSGRLVNISLTISPMTDNKGNVIGASKIARDITADILAQEKILQNELLFKTITNVAPVGLWMTDTKGRNNFVNDTWIEWTGIPAEQQASSGWFEAMVPEERETVDRQFQEAFRNRESFMAEFRIIRKDGVQRWVLSEGSPYYDIEGFFAGYAGSVTDITERKEDELRKNEFLAVASHELKTPLTSVKAYSQLLFKTYDKGNDEFLRNALVKVDSQVNKMTKLVGDFLNLSKIELNKFQLQQENFDLAGLVKEVVGEMQVVSLKHSIVLENADPVNVRADKDKIAQVVINFLNNAVKYSPEDKNITVSVIRENGQARVVVEDRGIGIKAEEREKIFERFYRSRFNNNISFSGFGIGLYISAEIIRRHNGTICVESESGKGARFYFTLPLAG